MTPAGVVVDRGVVVEPAGAVLVGPGVVVVAADVVVADEGVVTVGRGVLVVSAGVQVHRPHSRSPHLHSPPGRVQGLLQAGSLLLHPDLLLLTALLLHPGMLLNPVILLHPAFRPPGSSSASRLLQGSSRWGPGTVSLCQGDRRT